MSRAQCLIGLDIGSSSIKAVAINASNGEILALGQQATPITHEGSRMEVPLGPLRTAVLDALRALASSLPPACEPVGIATTSVGETGAPVDARGEGLRDAIWWQDSRASEQVARLVQLVGAERLDSIVGHPPDPGWGLGRIMWVREREPEIFEQTASWLPLADLVTSWLCGEQVTSPSLASRLMAWDQTARRWSDEVLTAADVDPGVMPATAPSGSQVGTLRADVARETGLPSGLSVVLGGHDRQCGAFAARGGRPLAVDSAGTAEGLLIPVEDASDSSRRLGTGIARYADVTLSGYTLAARVGLAGGLLDWAVRTFFDRTEGVTYPELLTAVKTPLDFNGIVSTTTFGRYTSPQWAAGIVPGMLWGLTTSHGRGDIIQALLEAPGFALRANLDLLEEWYPGCTADFRVEGGIVQNEAWLQARADITGRTFHALTQQHITGIGAALLAGVGTGVYSGHAEAGQVVKPALREWAPDPRRAARYDDAYRRIVLPLNDLLSAVSSTSATDVGLARSPRPSDEAATTI